MREREIEREGYKVVYDERGDQYQLRLSAELGNPAPQAQTRALSASFLSSVN